MTIKTRSNDNKDKIDSLMTYHIKDLNNRPIFWVIDQAKAKAGSSLKRSMGGGRAGNGCVPQASTSTIHLWMVSGFKRLV